MYCPQCTAWNEDDAKTCGFCGRDLTITDPAGASPPPPVAPGPPGAASQMPPPPPAPAYGMPPGASTSSPGLSAPGYGPRPSPKPSIKANWSLALGIIGTLCFCVGPVAGIPGLLLGIWAYRECTNEPHRFTGRGMAIAGIVLSILAIVVSLVSWLYYAAETEKLWAEIQQEWSQPAASEGEESVGASPFASGAAIMVQIIPALDSYRAAHGDWPAWAAGPRGANGHVPVHDPAYHMPTFRVWAEPSEKGAFATLTTPVAFLFQYPADPDAAVVSGTATYGYYTNGDGWIVYSPGPDGVYDIDPLAMYPAAPLTQTAADSLAALTYDPTNGAASRGDIIFMFEDVDY